MSTEHRARCADLVSRHLVRHSRPPPRPPSARRGPARVPSPDQVSSYIQGDQISLVTASEYSDCVGARLRLECGEGHVSRGQLEISCQANGVWSRAEGACHRISCGRPRSEPGATLLAASWVYGARVPFSCPSGQLPVNSPLLCTKDGTWTNEPAKCSPLH